jgi:CheY-like chemotaxis protein
MAKILFIDDDPAVLSLASTVLTTHGHHATLAINGSAGVRAYRAAAFDLVVTDLFMPVQDGIETIKQIRQISEATPILAISGSHRGAEYLRAASALGANGTLEKPFKPDHLIEEVDRLLNAFA